MELGEIRLGWICLDVVLHLQLTPCKQSDSQKEQLTKELKELHSERISLESQTTNASKQSELSKRLEGSGLKEITTPPIKLTKPHEQD